MTCVGFSHDGMYAASADLGGLIKVWKVDTGKEIWSFECSDIEVCIMMIQQSVFQILSSMGKSLLKMNDV